MGYSSPCYHDGRVYCALSDEGKTFCVDADSGKMIWTAETGSVIYDSSFCFGGGNVFIGCVNGTASAIRAADGKLMWRYRLGPGHLLASPAADEKLVYFSSMSGDVTALPVNSNAAGIP
jgi:outer membrane protein assembly factor BamB